MKEDLRSPEEVFDQEIFRMMQEEINSRKDEDYVINQPQYAKFAKLMRFLFVKACQLDGEIVENELVPHLIHGDAIVKFDYFEASGAELKEFKEILEDCSAVSACVSDDDKVRFSFTVPNVFVKA